MDAAPDYKIRRISWPPGSSSPRNVPILLQDANGPCPLIAIVNVLLLRGTLSLPQGVGEISQARVVELVAGHLLDANIARGEGGSDEYRANLQHNLADAISRLPKLTTGVDINVRFDGIRSVEFTDETAVFDLLGIDLVHGWLVDPVDAAAAAAVGGRSYNELVVDIITALGPAAAPSALSPTASRNASGQPAAVGGSGGSAAWHTEPPQERPPQERPPQGQPAPPPAAKAVDAAALSAALQSTLRITIPEGPQHAGTRSLSSNGSGLSRYSFKSEIGRMLGDTVSNAFKTPESTPGSIVAAPPLPAPPQDPPAAGLASSSSVHVVAREHGSPPATSPFQSDAEAAAAEAPVAAPAQPPPDDSAAVAATAPADARGEGAASSAAAATLDGAAPHAAPPADAPSAPGEDHHERRAGAGAGAGDRSARDALLARDFLDASASQLTVHGLASLHEGLRDGQLAVFFRNNHFNVVLRRGPLLCILVTDQGYLYEPGVVWERLDNVDGDTQLLGWDLTPFRPHAQARRPAVEGDEAAAAALAAAEWEQAAGGGGGGGGAGGTDADFALAMQLQQEEEERAREAEEQRRRRQAAVPSARPPAEEARRPPAGAGGSRPARAAAAAAAAAGESSKPVKKRSSDCVVM